MASKDIKTTHDDNPTGCDDINSDYYFQVVKSDSGELSDEGMSVPQMRAVLQQVAIPPDTDVFSMTLAFNSLNAIIGTLFGNYTHWQITQSDTPPVYTDSNWNPWPMQTVYPIATSWTAAILQPQTYYLYVKNTVEVLTITPSQTVTAQTDQAVPQTPNDVTFNDLTNIQANSFIVSNTVGISGLLAPTAITISGGGYAKNGASTFTSLDGVIENGDTIRLRQTSSANDSTLTTCTVQLGLREETWNITTAASGDTAGVISIVAATYSELESTATIDIDLRITGKTGSLDVGCRVSTLYDPNYHTAVEGVNYTTISGQVVQWTGTDTTDKTVSISLSDQNSTFNNVGELIIDSGSEFGGATIDPDLDATLFEIGGTAGVDAWQQAVGGDELVVVKLDDALNNGRLTHTPIGAYGWDEYPLRNGGSLSVTNNFPISTSPDYETTAPRLVIPIEFLATGTHYVWFECASIDNASNSLWMGLDGAITGVMFESANIMGTYVWSNNSTLNTVTVPSAGLHSMYMWAREERITITRMLLTTNSGYTPSGSVADSTWSTGGGTVTDNPDNPSLPQGPPPVVDDKTPDPFPFSEVGAAALSTLTTSNIETIIGINVPTPISIAGAGGTYSIDGGSFTSATGVITAGQTVQVRVTSSSSNSTEVITTLTIGTVSQSFSVTTEASGSVGLTLRTTTFPVTSSGTTVQDLDIRIPAGGGVGIQISNGVTNTTITNCRISSVDSHAITGTSIGSLTVHDCEISECWGDGVYVYGLTSANIYDNTINNVHTGVNLWQGRNGNITVQNNWIKNVFRRETGVASKNANGVHLAYCAGPDMLVDGNIIINEQGASRPEDDINFYNSSGTAVSPITITNNKMKGQNESTSSTTIILGDGTGKYSLAEDNIMVNAGQVGMGMGGNGYHVARRNKIYSAPVYKLTDPSVGVSNVGFSSGYTNYINNLPPIDGLVFEDNDVTFWKAANYNNTGSAEVLSPWYIAPGQSTPAGWSTNRFDTSTSQPAKLTDAIWLSAWDIRPVRIT